MSPDAPTDVVLSAGVVSFDGRVLELFGHEAERAAIGSLIAAVRAAAPALDA